jgi:hypothetical protein
MRRSEIRTEFLHREWKIHSRYESSLKMAPERILRWSAAPPEEKAAAAAAIAEAENMEEEVF